LRLDRPTWIKRDYQSGAFHNEQSGHQLLTHFQRVRLRQASRRMSPNGPNAKSSDVCFSAAIGG